MFKEIKKTIRSVMTANVTNVDCLAKSAIVSPFTPKKRKNKKMRKTKRSKMANIGVNELTMARVDGIMTKRSEIAMEMTALRFSLFSPKILVFLRMA